MFAFDEPAKKANLSGMGSDCHSCQPIFDVQNETYTSAACKKINNAIYNYIKSNEIKIVIFIARWSKFLAKVNINKNIFLPENNKYKNELLLHKNFAETLIMYNSIGTKIIIMMQPPEQINEQKWYTMLFIT